MATEEAPKDSSAPAEVFQLEALSLNYLRSQNISAIPDDDHIPKLRPCKLCNKAILNFRFEAFTILACGHLLHRICLETYIMRGGVRSPSCPICNWDIEINREELALALGVYHIESKDHNKGQASQQSNVTITDEDDDGGLEIMRSMGLIEEDEVTAEQTKQVNTEDRGTRPVNVYIASTTITAQVHSKDQTPMDANVDNSLKSIQNQSTSTGENKLPGSDSESRDTIEQIFPSKRTNVPEEDTPNKKQKMLEKKSANLKKLINELTAKELQVSEIGEEEGENSEDISHLYNKITNAEIRNEITSQNVIKCYYSFGKVLSERFKHYFDKSFNVHQAQIDVNEELEKQLPDTTEDARNKRKERAQKIYFLFSSIGVEKIRLVKSFSASSISKLTVENIKYIKDEVIMTAPQTT